MEERLTFWQYLRKNQVFMLIGMNILFALFWVYGVFQSGWDEEAVMELHMVIAICGLIDVVYIVGCRITYRALYP